MQPAPPPLSASPNRLPTSELAIASMVLGGVSLGCLLFPITSLPAVICGHLALRRIRSAGGQIRGRGLAIGGLITGYLGIALTILTILAIAIYFVHRQHSRNHRLATAAGYRTGNQANPQRITRSEFLGRGDFQNRPATDPQGIRCIANLHQIHAAKEMWAMDQRKSGQDEPTETDLIGPDKLLKAFPTCPAGGAYTIGNVETRPRCSQPGHVLP